MSQKQMYAPCPCGSGKKYRFCCHQKKRAQPTLRQKAAFWAGASPKSKNDDLYGGMDNKVFAKAYETCQRGLVFMNRGDYDRAIPIFRKAMSVSQDVHTSANNLAVCLFVTGRIDEACDVQRESIEASTFENPFGWGNLAVFEYIRGNEEEAKRCVDTAVGMESPSADASIKVCEALARFERHQDILNYIDAGDFGDDSVVCFYTGVAAANCGDFKRAKRDLKQMKPGCFKIEMARRYLRFLNEESSPHTVMGNWPYLQHHEICPGDHIRGAIIRDEDAWKNCRILVDLCEDLLNDPTDDSEKPMTFFSRARHPAAVDRFWAIVKGSFGPDSLRIQALQALQERGLVDPQVPVKVLIDGERREVELAVTRTHSDFRFTSRLPRKWESRYEETVRQMNQQDEPDWESAATTYLKVIEAVPDFFPARYNYAITLLNRGRKEQAEPILLELVEQHPEYLFAPSTLLQIYCDAERMDEADDLIQAISMPEETHPLALVAWLLAQYRFFTNVGRDEDADRCLQQAYAIMPDHPRVKAFWEKGCH